MRALTLLLLAGCGGADPSGLWLLTLDQSPADQLGLSCDEDVTENFAHAVWSVEQETESNWTETSATTDTGVAVVVRIETLQDGGAVLFFADAIYPGQQNDKGNWSFGWTDEHTETAAEAHADGYAYEITDTQSLDLDWTLIPSGGELTGTWRGRTVEQTDWSESDAWDSEEIGLSNGQIPASAYLSDTEDVWSSVSNDPDETDCDSDPCTLRVATACDDEVAITGARLDVEADESIEDYQLSATPDGVGE